MAPEQTGRMNRSIDSRSDLYSLGVTLYEILTGALPFSASDPMEWVHCHIARQPVAPCERRKDIPPCVSTMIMKLLAKTPEERYQTAAGIQHDLQRCLHAWETEHRIGEFPLGEHDTPDRLVIPEKLYGREREVEMLLAAFDRVVASGTPELVLVSGYSGVGKSSVVNELHKVLVPPRALFASGKFDQYKRDIPYSTLAQAFQNLIRPLLAKSDAELATWRGALQEALGPNARLIVDLVPELKLITGEPPPVPEVSPQDAQRRFQLVFRRFIGVFARPEHPLALFLDDFQWIDAATLDVIEDLLTQSDVRHLMLIGAYRDNEVDVSHPLMRKLDAIRQAGAPVQEITLAPLVRDDLAQLIADALRCKPERAAPLAQLVHEKTGGNPFFAIQFLSALAERGVARLTIMASGSGCWDIERIHAKGYTDNIVELMVGKLGRLPVESQIALQKLACLGNAAKVSTLSLVCGTAEAQVHADLFEAVRAELVTPQEGSYRFIHDRVQEAAYSLIPEESRAETHLRIGRLLVAHTPPEEREEAIFEIVNQLNRGVALITSRDEREQLAELNLIAGKRAKASTAYASALKYLTTGVGLLPDDAWERLHELKFGLELHRAECEFLTGELALAEERLIVLSNRGADETEQATVACLRIDLYTMTDLEHAVAVCLEYLSRVGIQWPAHPGKEDALREYERMQISARQPLHRGTHWSSAGERCGSGCDDSCPRENGSDCLNSRSQPPLLVDVPRRQSHSGTRELRRLLLRLCRACHLYWAIFWRLPGRLSVGEARLRTRRTTGIPAFRGQDVSCLRISHGVEQSRPGCSSCAAPSVRGRQSGWRSYSCRLLLLPPEHEPARGRRPAFRGTTRGRKWSRVCAEDPLRFCSPCDRDPAGIDPDAARLDLSIRVL